MKQLLLQAFNLIRQNPFYATISIIGTAVTIAFVMVVVMIYDFRTMDMAPESDRSDMMYTGSGMTYRKLDHTNQNSGMGRKAFEALFSELPGVKEVTWYRGVSKTPCNLSASNEIFNYYVRPVADNWFKFFDYEFIAGRPFTQEEYDARRWVSVITERMALQLFGTTDVVGKEYQSNFFPTKVVGVVKDVNAIFQTAYADAFVPFSLEIDQTFIGAILTAIGYSINDKVVIFDRVREFFGLYPKRNKRQLFNDSLNTTLARTINTSLSTLIVLLCIFILGGDSIRSFAFAMILGVIIGTLSSLFIASPIAYTMLSKKKETAETTAIEAE